MPISALVFTVPPPPIFRAYSFSSKAFIIMYKLAIASLLATSAAAFAPAQSAGRASTSLNLNGWTADEVRDIKSSEMNFSGWWDPHCLVRLLVLPRQR